MLVPATASSTLPSSGPMDRYLRRVDCKFRAVALEEFHRLEEVQNLVAGGGLDDDAAVEMSFTAAATTPPFCTWSPATKTR